MSNLNKQTQDKLVHLLTKEAEPKEFAKSIRRFTVEAIKLVLENEGSIKKEWISDGHYWLTELCEILDPQLE